MRYDDDYYDDKEQRRKDELIGEYFAYAVIIIGLCFFAYMIHKFT